jgi:hypothetical protein
MLDKNPKLGVILNQQDTGQVRQTKLCRLANTGAAAPVPREISQFLR